MVWHLEGMTETRKHELEDLLRMTRDLLAQARSELRDEPHGQEVDRTLSYSLSLLNVAISSFKQGRIPGDDAPYSTDFDEMEENDRLQTLVLEAALDAPEA